MGFPNYWDCLCQGMAAQGCWLIIAFCSHR
nr:MAG TPA: hypothetical protein [Caudoviricetes sp.]